MKDELVRAMTKDGWVKAVAITSTGIVERARQVIEMEKAMFGGVEDDE